MQKELHEFKFSTKPPKLLHHLLKGFRCYQ